MSNRSLPREVRQMQSRICWRSVRYPTLRSSAARRSSLLISFLQVRVLLRARSPFRQRLLTDERIGEALVAEGRGLAVAGHEAHVVAQRKQLGTDRADQGLEIAVGMFPGAD